ncbi:MAG: type II secretion system protein [Desulfobacterales bacterium]
MPLSQPARGFTLIEILVAMMLLSICLVVILQLFSGGLKSGKTAEDYTRAVFYAREKMEEYLLMEDFQEGVFEGTFDDVYRWRADITYVEPEDEEPERLVDLFQVNVSVFWAAGKREKEFQISTLKITEKREVDA